MENQVTVHGYLAKEVIDTILPQSHLLLLLGNDHPKSQFVIHGKLYAYMAARRPILAIVNKHGDMSKIIEDYQLGAAFLYTEIDQMTAWIATVFENYKSKTSKPLNNPIIVFREKNKPKNYICTSINPTIDGNRCQTNISKYTHNLYCLYVWGHQYTGVLPCFSIC